MAVVEALSGANPQGMGGFWRPGQKLYRGAEAVTACLMILAVLVFPAVAHATCVAVGPTSSGDGSGTSWTNRRALSGSLSRGNTYYLMDGSYGDYDFNTGNSGTTRITFKKAQAYDFGRTSDGCSNDISAGWNAATMGSGQAAFVGITGHSNAGYVTWDGNGQSSGTGCGTAPGLGRSAKDCGIKVALPQGAVGGDNMVVNVTSSGTTGNNWTFRSVEMVGCNCVIPSGANETILKCRAGTCNNLLIEYNYWHDAGCDYIKPSSGDGGVIRHSYFYRNKFGSSPCHSQWMLSDGRVSNWDIYSNVIRDVGGTAIFSILNGGHWSNFRIYNNVITWSATNPARGLDNGIFACINSGSTCTNLQFIGNSVVNEIAVFNSAGGIRDENGGGSYTWKNNLFYKCRSDQGSTAISFGLHGSQFVEDHNSWLECGSPASGDGDITVTSNAPNPFVDWPNSDFELATNDPDWQNGTPLASPFDTDTNGSTRPGNDGIWNRGAWEYDATAGTTRLSAPEAPQDLRVIL